MVVTIHMAIVDDIRGESKKDANINITVNSDVKATNIHVHNLSIPAKAIGNIGVAAAVGATANAAATVVKGTAIPTSVKAGVILGVGAAGGAVAISVNAMISLVQNYIEGSKNTKNTGGNIP